VTMTMTMTVTVTLTVTLYVLAIRQCIAEVCSPPEQPVSVERESLDHRNPQDTHPSIPVFQEGTLESL
jgi:hypothetical protein